MKKFLLLVLSIGSLFLTGCFSTVPAGNVGVKIYLLGGEKGVDHEVLTVGRYWIGINEELYLFPTFQQNYVWTKDNVPGSETDESITFQTNDGMQINADIGITYAIKPENVGKVFQKYRRGVNEITDVVLRNMVRDAFVRNATKYDAEAAYSSKKNEMMTTVLNDVKTEAEKYGVSVDNIYFIGGLRLPEQIIKALNSKIEAIQTAQKTENELRQAEAQAKKVYAEAEGAAKSIEVVAAAQARANELISRSLTQQLVEYKKIEKWNGITPTTVLANASSTLVNVK